MTRANEFLFQMPLILAAGLSFELLQLRPSFRRNGGVHAGLVSDVGDMDGGMVATGDFESIREGPFGCWREIRGKKNMRETGARRGIERDRIESGN